MFLSFRKEVSPPRRAMGPAAPAVPHRARARDTAHAGSCGTGSVAALPGAGPMGSREPPDIVQVTEASPSMEETHEFSRLSANGKYKMIPIECILK